MSTYALDVLVNKFAITNTPLNQDPNSIFIANEEELLDLSEERFMGEQAKPDIWGPEGLTEADKAFMFVLKNVGEVQQKLVIKDICIDSSMWIYYTIYNLVRFFFIVIYFYLVPFLVVLFSLVFAYRKFEKILDEDSTQYVTAI